MKKPLPCSRRSRLALAIAALAAVAVTAGCAGGSDSDHSAESTGISQDSGGAAGSAPEPGEAAPTEAAGDQAMSERDGDSSTSKSNSTGDDAKRVEPGTPAVISTGSVSLEAKDVAKARLEVRKVVDKFRGTVTDQETTTDEGKVDTARLVLRIPSADFSAATAALEGIATLTESTSSAEDVTSQVIDVDVRIRAQSKSVERIEALLARATTIEQIVAIESQLSTRQAALDSLISRQKYLADQTSMSTITVYVEKTDPEKADKPDTEDAGGFLGGLTDGWDSFTTGAVAVLAAVGFLLPWAGLLLLISVPVWLLLRRRPRGQRGATATPPPPPATA